MSIKDPFEVVFAFVTGLGIANLLGFSGFWTNKSSRCLCELGKPWSGTISGSGSGVFSSVDCVDVGVHIAFVNKAKPLFQQFEIVRIVDSQY
jgi:hypothetical protein